MPPRPDWVAAPELQGRDALTPESFAGTWYAADSGLELSLGAQLEITFDGAAPRIELVDFEINGMMRMPVEGLSVEGDRVRFETEGSNRRYRISMAMEGEVLHVLVERPRSTDVVYRNAWYRREDTGRRFERLRETFEALERRRRARGLEAALVSHYEALGELLGEDELLRRVGQAPLQDEWLLVMTSADLLRNGESERGLEHAEVAARRFPRSPYAHEQLGRALQAVGRAEDAEAALEQARKLAEAETDQ
jgi:tetratricopeptide (TPR) repeat protein